MQFTQHLELDSKKEAGLDSVDRGVLESTGEDKGIVIGQCDNILHNSCLVTDSPPTQSMEYFPIKQENICTSYLPKEGPSSTVPKKSRKIQDRIDMYNETESPAKIPRKKMETTPSTAATLQTTVLILLHSKLELISSLLYIHSVLYFLCRLVRGMQMKIDQSKYLKTRLKLQHLDK